jgi:hypothetical protein
MAPAGYPAYHDGHDATGIAPDMEGDCRNRDQTGPLRFNGLMRPVTPGILKVCTEYRSRPALFLISLSARLPPFLQFTAIKLWSGRKLPAVSIFLTGRHGPENVQNSRSNPLQLRTMVQIRNIGN